MDKIFNPGASLTDLPLINNTKTVSISAENPQGEPGSGGKAHSKLGPSRKGKPCISPVKKGRSYTLAEIDGPAILQSFWITNFDKTEHGPYVLRDIVFRIYWDDEKDPSVEVPLGDFFCNGFGRRCAINSNPIAVNSIGGLNCYFPMPFLKKAKITIENQHNGDIPAFFYQFNFSTGEDLPNNIGYFHSSWRRENPTTIGKDYIIADNIEGKGHYIGTYLAIAALEKEWWGEGEIKFFINDDDTYPSICGTGVEDYFGGAWCFDKKLFECGYYSDENVVNYSTPYLGYPFTEKNSKDSSCIAMHGLYRWHILDPIRFAKKLKVTIQQIGAIDGNLFERSDDVSSVAYWYQAEPHNRFLKLPDPEKRWPI